MSSTYSAESAALALDLSGPECELSPSAKSIRTAAPFSQSTGLEYRSSGTSAPCEGPTWEPLTLFAEDTHASPSPLPGSELARQMTATSGRNIAGLSKSSGPLGSLERTLLGTSHWASTKCFLTWKHSATKQGRLLFRLSPSMPDTDGTESGLWPTPAAMVPNLNESVDSVLERRARIKAERKNGNGFGLQLTTAVKLWPTPSANEDAAGTPNGKMQKMLGNHPDIRNSGSGTLNPTLVEWLMGFPLGWTALEPSETPSSRRSRKSSGGQS